MQGIGSPAAGGAAAPSRRPFVTHVLLVLGGLAAGALVLASIELVLRAVDAGGGAGLFSPDTEPDGTRVMRLSWNPQFQRPQDPQPHRSFLAHKPPGTFRIFVIGESSAEGVPYGTGLAFSSWLARRLEAQAPEVRWEVVNVALAGATARSMVAMVREITKHAPDLLVVYLGHNEIGARLTSEERALLDPDHVELRGWLSGLRLYRVVASALPRRGKHLDLPRAPGAAGRMGSPADYASDADREAIARAYRANLETMVRLMRAAGARTVLVTLSQNLSDWAPNVSIHRRRLGRAEKRAWREAVRRGRRLAPRDCEAALAAWREALALDDGFAMLHFEMAQCERRLGHLDAAREHYRRASDLDCFTQGALLSFNTILRDVAGREGALLVDVDAAFTQVSGARLVGDDLFIDPLHPNLRAHQLIARAVAEELRRNGVGLPPERWRADAYVDPDPEEILDANPELRLKEQLAYALGCHAAGRTTCSLDKMDAIKQATTDPAMRRALEQALTAPPTATATPAPGAR